MQQEATEELVCVQAHQLLLVAVCGVAPTEVDVVIAQCNESVVGDCDTMRVRAEIAQDVLGTSEGTLGVDDPVVTEEGAQPCCEATRISQMQQAVMESECSVVECRLQPGSELTAEDAT